MWLAIHDTALCINTTRAIFQARVATFTRITTFVRFTVVILRTFKLYAFGAGFTFVAIGAIAKHAMIGDSAERITTASRLICAWIGAFTFGTALIGGTIGVGFAASQTCAAFAELSQWTIAAGAALLATLTTCANLSTSAVFGTRTGVGAVRVCFVTLTVGVAALWWLLTAAKSIAKETIRAATLHPVVDHQTVGALTTLTRRLAGILALLVDARLTAGAGEIVATTNLAYAIFANLSLCASGVCVANGATSTAHATLIGQAVLIIAAFTLTAATIAKLISIAVLVTRTSGTRRFTRHLRIADKTLWACALLAMINDQTFGIGATCSWFGAWIDTLLIDT